MEQLKLSNFISSYPDINDTNFTKQLFQKKELYDLILDSEEKVSDNNIVLKHQKIISIFLSSYTMYNSLLLFHSMGTGKSIAAIYTAQSILQERFGINKIYFCTNTDIIRDNLINELLIWDPSLKPADFFSLTENEKKRRIKKKLEENNYFFLTFIEMYNEYNKTGKQANKYKNSLLIFDEIHDVTKSDLYIKSKTGVTNKDKYNTIKDIIHKVTVKTPSSKVLLMSGTPMTDKASEISKVLNLIVPTKLSEDDKFNKDFLDEDNIMSQEDKIEEFNKLTKGYISYLKNQKSISTKFIGDTITSDFVNIFKIQCIKDGNQDQVITDLLQNKQPITQQDALGSNIKQAGLFVFPDNTFGKEGYSKYVIEEKKNVRDPILKKSKKVTIFKLSDMLKNTITSSNLKNYSIKYHNILNLILKKPKECHFIYCDLIKGSGLQLFTLLLEHLLGYRRCNLKNYDDKTKPKYILLTGESKSNYQIKLINKFNEEPNKYGDYVNVIIGTDKIKQGVSFNHIQHIHITIPHWNYAKTEQIIARGIRFGSHKYLPKKTAVKVYLYSLITSRKKSHDEYVYKLCSQKDKSIKSVEYNIKLNAIDCNLFFKRNFMDDSTLDNTRECEYEDCDYVCNYFDNNTSPINPYIELD